MEAKRISESEVVLSQLMQPEHANNLGNIHGGVLMKLIDEAGGMCATRHARYPAVTVAVDSLTFLEPVHIGDLVTFRARLTYVGRTSMETEVIVEAEEILTGRLRITNQAYLVYVALDSKNRRPVEVPRLILETGREHERWEQAEKRQKERLLRKAQHA
ncbi:MAG: acyl-CoA thioesterase [Deltaproteobacteria bacterium]|nr:acyl-CoA thioesterase [Deltaproteobacteria bacterium]MCL5791707.1 acyl-CoA thioesterase [Deltaproteobacteria bacterium]